jgi:hypothetical protein
VSDQGRDPANHDILILLKWYPHNRWTTLWIISSTCRHHWYFRIDQNCSVCAASRMVKPLVSMAIRTGSTQISGTIKPRIYVTFTALILVFSKTGGVDFSGAN